jgi:RNA polymerase sigma-70 factor (ECF subfamily)
MRRRVAFFRGGGEELMDIDTTETASFVDQLVERLRKGDKEVLADLFAHYRQRLWRTVQLRMDRRLFGRVDADDILQEAYLDAARRVHHYIDQNNSLSAFVWLRLIVNQTLIDVHRRHLGAQKRDARLEVSIHQGHDPPASSVSLADYLMGHLTSPSQAAMRSEAAAQLEKVVDGMDPIDREVLVLRHFEELTNSEVAEVLGLQQKAASIRYVRALKRLKEALADVPLFSEEY